MLTVRDISHRLDLPRATVAYAIDKADIRPAQRAGLVRLFSPLQWPEIVRAVRSVKRRPASESFSPTAPGLTEAEIDAT